MRCLIVLVAALSSFACGGGEDTRADAGPTDGTVTSTRTGTVGFLEPCASSPECMTGLCYRFNMATVGLRCTKTCSSATDCPPPSPGCNNMGVCKHSGG